MINIDFLITAREASKMSKQGTDQMWLQVEVELKHSDWKIRQQAKRGRKKTELYVSELGKHSKKELIKILKQKGFRVKRQLFGNITVSWE